MAKRYNDQGADELAFDITASVEARGLLYDLIEARRLAGVHSAHRGRWREDRRRPAALLNAGADKVSINTAGVNNPQIFNDASHFYGAQCVVAAIDAKKRADGSGWEVSCTAGARPTGKDAVAWAREVAERGAGEILLTSMDRDGAKIGFDLELTVPSPMPSASW